MWRERSLKKGERNTKKIAAACAHFLPLIFVSQKLRMELKVSGTAFFNDPVRLSVVGAASMLWRSLDFPCASLLVIRRLFALAAEALSDDTVYQEAFFLDAPLPPSIEGDLRPGERAVQPVREV